MFGGYTTHNMAPSVKIQCQLLLNGREEGGLGTDRKDKYDISHLLGGHLSLAGQDKVAGAQPTYTLSFQMMFHIVHRSRGNQGASFLFQGF